MDLTKNKEKFRDRYFKTHKKVITLITELSKTNQLSNKDEIKLQSIDTIYTDFLKDIFFELFKDYP